MRFLLLVSILGAVLAKAPNYYYYTCLTAATSNNAVMKLVADMDPEDYVAVYGTYCKTRDIIMTMYDCIQTSANIANDMGYKHTDRKAKDSYNALVEDCKAYYHVSVGLSYAQAAAAWEALPKPLANYTYANETGTLPFSIPEVVIAPVIPAEEDNGDNLYYTDKYAAWLLYYIAICVGMAAVFNGLTWVLPKGASLLANNIVGRYFRRYVTTPPLWNAKLARWSHFHSNQLPPLQIFGLFVMNTVMLSVNYRYHEGYYDTRSSAIGDMIGWRTAIMVMYKLPFLFFFAGRNNFLITITGWDYSVFNLWHRWLGRIATIDVLIHWAAYSVGVGSYLAEEWAMWYWIAGVIAALIMVIMCTQGSVWFRRKAYEIFLYLHIFLAVAFLVFAWYHVIWVSYPMETLYACFAVWGYDRAARFSRIAFSGVCSANLTLGADNVVVIDIKDKNPVRAFPGSHVFIYFMDRRIFYQSHPFTVVKTGDGLRLYLKSWNGATKRIQEKIAANGGSLKMKVLVEGPYGVPLNLKSFDELVCFAGGIGITSIYSHLSSRIASGDVGQKVTLHWVVRHQEFLTTFSEDIKKFVASGINVVIHVTGHKSEVRSLEESLTSPDESIASKEKPLFEITSQNFEIEQGRPDLNQIVPEAISNAAGPLAFLTCGPPGLNRDVRSLISKNLLATKHYVEEYEEGFEM